MWSRNKDDISGKIHGGKDVSHSLGSAASSLTTQGVGKTTRRLPAAEETGGLETDWMAHLGDSHIWNLQMASFKGTTIVGDGDPIGLRGNHLGALLGGLQRGYWR